MRIHWPILDAGLNSHSEMHTMMHLNVQPSTFVSQQLHTNKVQTLVYAQMCSPFITVSARKVPRVYLVRITDMGHSLHVIRYSASNAFTVVSATPTRST